MKEIKELEYETSIEEILEWLNINENDLSLIYEMNMFDLLNQMIKKDNDINLCLNDLKNVFKNNQIIGNIMLNKDNDIVFNKIIEKDVKCLLLFIKDNEYQKYYDKFKNIELYICYKKSSDIDVNGFILG